MTRKSLKDAVLDVAVRYYTFPPKTFSAYDITKQLRTDVNAKQYDIAEFDGVPSNHGQEISHSLVRDTVASLFDTKHLDRKYNGTFMEYSVGTIPSVPQISLSCVVVPPAPDITTEALYTTIVNALMNFSAIDRKLITPSSLLVKDLGFDDLDFVEAIMQLEEELASELGKKELDTDLASAQKIRTVGDLYHFVKANIETAKNLALKIPAGVLSNPTPVIPPPAPKPDAILKMYIQARLKKGTSPSLRNAQKAINTAQKPFKVKGQSVREISDLAKGLGYKVIGSTHVPFSNWLISR